MEILDFISIEVHTESNRKPFGSKRNRYYRAILLRNIYIRLNLLKVHEIRREKQKLQFLINVTTQVDYNGLHLKKKIKKFFVNRKLMSPTFD